MKRNSYLKSRFIARQSRAIKDATQRALTPEATKPEPTTEDRAMASTKDVIDHHLKCFGEGDLDGILSDYAPDAVLFTPAGLLKGEDAIRPLFQAMIAEFEKPGAKFSLKQKFIEAGYAYILWTAETADNFYDLGTDTFVVEAGKIVAQSFTSKMIPKDLKHFGSR
jgi:hypothetical protein